MKPSLADECKTEATALRVLFFEDDTEDIELTMRALRAADFEVVSEVATTLGQFRDKIRSNSYDIVLSDYRMPGTTGMDCLAAMKTEGISIPFILVTGSLGDEKAVECLKEGVADYVLKDRLARLPVAIRRALEEQQLKAAQAQAQEALRRSEASYCSLVQNAPCGILRLDARSGLLLEANAALSEMLGYAAPSELLEHSAAGGLALPAEARARLMERQEQDGQRIACEIEWKRTDGTPLVVGLRGRLLLDQGRAPDCFELIAENLTERRRAEERIGQLNRLYSVLSHAGQVIVGIRDRDQLFREICRVVVEHGGFQMAWIGLTESDKNLVRPVASWGEAGYLEDLYITSENEPAGCGPVGIAIRENRHVVCNDLFNEPRMAPWSEHARCRNFRSVGAFPLVAGTRAIGALAIYANTCDFFDDENIAVLDKLAANLSFALESITAEEMRRRAEDELNQFFILSLDLLSVSNTEGYLYRLNPAWEKTLGFSLEELCSKPWVEFVHPDDRPQALAAAGGLTAGRAVEELELRFACKDGSYRWLMGSATPGVDRGIVFAAVSDITERKHLEEQLRSQNEALEEQNRRVKEASRMKSEFLANMSHELRSPLNGIIGFTELLYDGKLGPIADKPRDFLNRIQRSARHLLQLINGVLDLSKVEAGRLELQRERVRLSNTVQEVTASLAALAGEKRIRIEIELDPDVDSVITDVGRLKQILYNYLSNALKFTGEGGKVNVRLKPEGTTEFRLEVADTGIGIAAKDIPRLFTEFQQLDSTAAKRYQGTGLGLALTKRIVEAQGGRVGVESCPGEGSTFYAVLPRQSRSVIAPHILVVEDDKLQGVILARMLQNAGYEVETAATSSEAVAKCRERRFDAITLDLLLPDGSGDQALAQIRSLQNYRETPVIVVSVIEHKDAAISYGIQGFLTKPVGQKELVAALERSGIAMEREGVA